MKSVIFFVNSDYAQIKFHNNSPSLKFRYSDIKELREKIKTKNLNDHQITIEYREQEKISKSILSWILPLVFFIGVCVFIITIIILIIRYLKKNDVSK